MFSKFFIERPIFATVIALIIVIAGLVAMKALPVAQYPTITPVQVQVYGNLSRRGLEDGRRFCGGAHRGPGKRRRQHALHDIDEFQHRPDDPDSLLHSRHRSRHRPGASAKPGKSRHASASRGSGAVRRLGAEKVVQHVDDHRGLQQGWPLQPGVRD